MAYRELLDDRGTSWTVWDTYPDSGRDVEAEELRNGWLTFRSDRELRRLIPAPIGWSEAPDAKLLHWLELSRPATLRLEEEAREGARSGAGTIEEPPLLRPSADPHGSAADELAAVVARSRAMLERFRVASEARTPPEESRSRPPGGSD